MLKHNFQIIGCLPVIHVMYYSENVESVKIPISFQIVEQHYEYSMRIYQ